MANIQIQKGDKPQVGGEYTPAAKVDDLVKSKIDSINKALIPDQAGTIMVKVPTMRDPETRQMQYMKIPHKEIDVPPHEVVYYTGGVIADFHSAQSEYVSIRGKATGVVFDRTYDYKGKTYYRCAWIPDQEVRAGVLYQKKVNNRKPVAVLKKLKDEKTPAYQLVEGDKETNYRDLKRIFERVFIKVGRGDQEYDEKLDNWAHEAIPPIPEEVSS